MNRKYPRLQMRTIAELLEGKKLDIPVYRGHTETFKKAPKAKARALKHGKIEYPETPAT